MHFTPWATKGANLLLSVALSKSADFNAFFTVGLDFKTNGTCTRMNFAHLTQLMFLHYLMNVETPKM